MGKGLLIVQRFYYNFREGFFDYLVDKGIDFSLINSTTSRGKVKVHAEAKEKPFISETFKFFKGDSYVIFPFLFFKMIWINPRIIVSEGGQNTINNIQIYIYSRLFNRDYIIWDLGKGYADFGSSFLRNIYMHIYIFILRKSIYVFGYNTQSKTYFKSLGISEDKIVILNNTIDTRKISAIRKTYIPYIPDNLELAVQKNYTFVIFVGALVKSKNIEALAELMKLLGDQYFLIIIGEGTREYKEKLEVSFNGTNHFFAGYKKNEQLSPYYDLASFSVLPGLGGLSINQSMAFGVPVVCKGADGAEKDLVINDQTGYVYESLDDACNYIRSKTRNQWKSMGESAEKLLFSEHSVERMMDKFISYCIKEQ
jgi:glycosyltransferase involved in cell wall biosynthesis